MLSCTFSLAHKFVLKHRWTCQNFHFWTAKKQSEAVNALIFAPSKLWASFLFSWCKLNSKKGKATFNGKFWCPAWLGRSWNSWLILKLQWFAMDRCHSHRREATDANHAVFKSGHPLHVVRKISASMAHAIYREDAFILGQIQFLSQWVKVGCVWAYAKPKRLDGFLFFISHFVALESLFYMT